MIELYHFTIPSEVYCISTILGAILLFVRLYLNDCDLEDKKFTIFANLHLALALFLLMFGLVGVAIDTQAYHLKWKSRFWSSFAIGLAAAYTFFEKKDKKNA